MKGTTLPDQRDRLGVTVEKMALIESVAAFVTVISSLVNGILMDIYRLKAMLIITIYLLVSAALLIIMKYLTSYGTYFALYLVYKYCMPGIDTMGNIIMLYVWREKATGPLYIIHMGYYIGGSVGPFMARPFLSPDVDEPLNITNAITSVPTTEQISTISPPRFQEGSRIQIPFLFVSLIMILDSICFLFAYFHVCKKTGNDGKSSQQKSSPLKEIFSLKACSQSHSSQGYTLFFLITFSLFYFLNVATFIPLGDYLFTYATEGDLKFEKEDAAIIDGVFYFCGLLGRLFSGILSIWLPVYITFGVNISACLIFSIGEAIWGRTSQLGFVICAWGHSLFYSPTWPGCIAWTDRYIVLTATGYFALSVGSSLGRMIMSPVYGSFYDKGNPEATMYGLALFATLMFFLALVRQIVGLKQGSRFEKSTEEIGYKDNVEVVKYDQFEEHSISDVKSSPI